MRLQGSVQGVAKVQNLHEDNECGQSCEDGSIKNTIDNSNIYVKVYGCPDAKVSLTGAAPKVYLHTYVSYYPHNPGEPAKMYIP